VGIGEDALYACDEATAIRQSWPMARPSDERIWPCGEEVPFLPPYTETVPPDVQD
jgi:hypothetical protein